MQLNFYYGGAISEADQESKYFSRVAIEILRKHGKVLTEHIALPDTRDFDDKNIKKGVNISERDMAWLNDSDITVLDISKASTGTGFEVLYSTDVRGNPTLALYRNNSMRASPMITQFNHPLLTVGDYSGEKDLEAKINNFVALMQPRFKPHSNLVMCDAIDGAGKGVIAKAVRAWGEKQGKKPYDLVTSGLEEIPTWEELKTAQKCDMLLVAEPTYTDVGKVIRGELISKGHSRKYSAISTAHGYSLDREILYKKLVLDALKEGALVFSDRGHITSLVYQPVQAELFDKKSREFTYGKVLGLPGNQFTLSNPPGLMIIPQVDPAVAEARMAAREKTDNVKFENSAFQRAIAEVYASGRIRSLFERRGTKVVPLDMKECPTEADTMRKATEIVDNYFSRVA